MAKRTGEDEVHRIHRELEQGKVAPVYLFYGAEDFLVAQALEAVQSHVLAGIPVDFNFDQYHGTDCDPRAVVESADMLPMMAERRLVVLREAFALKPSGLRRLVDYLASPSPTTVLVMTAGQIPKTRKPEDTGDVARAQAETQAETAEKGATVQDLVKAARKAGRVVEFRTYYEHNVGTWIRGEVARRGKTIDRTTITFLIDMVGTNLRELHAELNKVCTFVGERKAITLDDVQQIISDVKADDIFAFTNAVGEKNADVALLHLRKLFESAVGSGFGASGRVVSMLHRHYLQLYQAKRMLAEGVAPREIAKRLGVKSSIAWKWEKRELEQARAMSEQQLLDALRRLYDTSLALRTSRVPADIRIEALILQLCAR